MDKITCHKQLGQAGEDFAVAWLDQRCLEVHARNYHSNGGEIDIIVYDPYAEYYLMVEVKTRSNRSGIRAINSQKLRRMRHAAEHYFFKKLDLEYAPDYELWALVVQQDRGRLQVIEWLAV